MTTTRERIEAMRRRVDKQRYYSYTHDDQRKVQWCGILLAIIDAQAPTLELLNMMVPKSGEPRPFWSP